MRHANLLAGPVPPPVSLAGWSAMVTGCKDGSLHRSCHGVPCHSQIALKKDCDKYSGTLLIKLKSIDWINEFNRCLVCLVLFSHFI